MIIELIALGLVLAMGWLLWSGYFLYNALAFMSINIALSIAYMSLGAPFVGAMQLIVYVSGALVLLAYGMMLGTEQEATQPRRRSMLVVGLICSTFAWMLLYVWQFFPKLPPSAQENPADTLTELGILMVGRYGALMELFGIVLLVVLVGVVRLFTSFLPKKT